MKVLLTRSSGRIGRAIFNTLIPHHTVIGLDRSPFSTTSLLGDVADAALLRTALQEVDAVVHTASLHAPHVGMASEAEFHRVNVDGLRTLCRLAKGAGVKRIVYTSTTALYGGAIVPGTCTWVDETLPPQPRTIYHRTKLDAEQILEAEANTHFSVRVLRMSRCFPEQAHEMAAYRLHRGIDARDPDWHGPVRLTMTRCCGRPTTAAWKYCRYHPTSATAPPSNATPPPLAIIRRHCQATSATRTRTWH